MSENTRKMKETQTLRKEAKKFPARPVFVDDSEPNPSHFAQLMTGEVVEIKPEKTVKEGAFTWVWAEATGGQFKDKRRGFVAERFLAPVESEITPEAPYTTFDEAVSHLDFASACFMQAEFHETNPAYLYAVAWAESGSTWTDDKVKATSNEGVFQYPPKVWQAFAALPEADGIGANEIRFPNAQCIIAAIEARNAATELKKVIQDRGISAFDLYLAHLFSEDGSFGVNGAQKLLAAEKQNAGQPVKPVLDTIYAGKTEQLAALLTRKPHLFGADGAFTVGQFVDACVAKLKEGFGKVTALAHEIAGQAKPVVKPPETGEPVAGEPSVSDPAVEEPEVRGPVQVNFDGPLISVTAADQDALARVSQSEVGHFGKYGDDVLAGALGAVVDTIINRVAHPSREFPDTIQGVVNKRHQFSAVTAAGGSWKGLPKARAGIFRIIEQHLTARSTGAASLIEGAQHFLNPFKSSAAALRNWGNHVVAKALQTYGSKAKRDIHYHGYAPGYLPPSSYGLAFAGNVHHFKGDGKSLPAVGQATPVSADKIVSICMDEWRKFEHGARKENQSPQFRRVGDYWKGIGFNKRDGKTNQPWSSAFISYVIRKAGGGAGFNYNAAHCYYAQGFVSGWPDAIYKALRPEGGKPQPGDILHYGRGSAARFDFDKAKAHFSAGAGGKFYSSHSDIVIGPGRTANTVYTIGGNVTNSVGRKTVKLNADGTLKPRNDGKPWICILRLIA